MCSWCHCFSRFKYTYFCPCLVIICRFFVGCITIRSSISPYSCTLCTQRTFLLPRLHLTHCCCYPNWGAPASVLFTVSFNGLFRWIIVLIWLQPLCFPVASHGFPLSWLYILRQRHYIFLVFSPPFLASDPLTNIIPGRGQLCFGASQIVARGEPWQGIQNWKLIVSLEEWWMNLFDI